MYAPKLIHSVRMFFLRWNYTAVTALTAIPAYIYLECFTWYRPSIFRKEIARSKGERGITSRPAEKSKSPLPKLSNTATYLQLVTLTDFGFIFRCKKINKDDSIRLNFHSQYSSACMPGVCSLLVSLDFARAVHLVRLLALPWLLVESEIVGFALQRLKSEEVRLI